MNNIYTITENNEVITARDTMNNAIVAAIRRITVCGYICAGFKYGESLTTIEYFDLNTHETRTMFIQETSFREGV